MTSVDRSRPRRTCRVDGSGFYHEMSTMCQKYLEPEQLDVSGNGVYRVERVNLE